MLERAPHLGRFRDHALHAGPGRAPVLDLRVADHEAPCGVDLKRLGSEAEDPRIGLDASDLEGQRDRIEELRDSPFPQHRADIKCGVRDDRQLKPALVDGVKEVGHSFIECHLLRHDVVQRRREVNGNNVAVADDDDERFTVGRWIEVPVQIGEHGPRLGPYVRQPCPHLGARRGIEKARASLGVADPVVHGATNSHGVEEIEENGSDVRGCAVCNAIKGTGRTMHGSLHTRTVRACTQTDPRSHGQHLFLLSGHYGCPVDGEIGNWQAQLDSFWEAFDYNDAPKMLEDMRALVAQRPSNDPIALAEWGGVNDALGLEEEAVGPYRKALAIGLDPLREHQVTLQLASTLRNLGEHDEAIRLLAALDAPELGDAPAAFLALTLHSAGQKDAALRTALTALATHLPRYGRSVVAYSKELIDEA